MKEELYISDRKVDLGQSSITLNYTNKIFVELDKMCKNHSYTIKLPKTQRNKAIFCNADSPAISQYFAKNKMKAQYLVDGVVVVNNADVYLLCTTVDTYEIALTFGTGNQLSRIVSNKAKLSDLKERWEYEAQGNAGYPDWHLLWNNYSISEYNNCGDMFVPLVHNGRRIADNAAHYHPAVSVQWVLDRIAADNGLTFSIPAAQKAFIGELFLPLTTRNDNMRYAKMHTITLNTAVIENVGNGDINLYFENQRLSRTGYASVVRAELAAQRTFVKGFVTASDNVKILLSGELKVGLTNKEIPNELSFDVIYKDKNTGNIVDAISIDYDELIEQEATTYYAIFRFRDAESSVIPFGSDVTFRITGCGFVGKIERTEMRITMYCDTINPAKLMDRNTCNGHYAILPNLPAMTQIDFIKSVAAITGLHPIPVDDTNRIAFVSLDDIMKKEVADWTKRIVGCEHAPREMVFSLGHIARKNWLRYKNDGDDGEKYSAHIDSLSASLDDEKNLHEIEFAGSEMRGDTAFVKLYTYDHQGAQKLHSVQPRILKKVNRAGKVAGVFTGLSFAELTKKWYVGYQRIIEKVKVVKEMVSLTPPELKALDIMQPIYLKQYGAHFLILSLKTGKNYINEVELLKLD